MFRVFGIVLLVEGLLFLVACVLFGVLLRVSCHMLRVRCFVVGVSCQVSLVPCSVSCCLSSVAGILSSVACDVFKVSCVVCRVSCFVSLVTCSLNGVDAVSCFLCPVDCLPLQAVNLSASHRKRVSLSNEMPCEGAYPARQRPMPCFLVGWEPKVLLGRQAAHFWLGLSPSVVGGLASGSTRRPVGPSETEYNHF